MLRKKKIWPFLWGALGVVTLCGGAFGIAYAEHRLADGDWRVVPVALSGGIVAASLYMYCGVRAMDADE